MRGCGRSGRAVPGTQLESVSCQALWEAETQSIMALPCPLRVSIVGNKLWRQLTVGPAALHPWAAVSSPPSAQLRMGSGSLPHTAWTLLHSACCPQSPWTTRLACLQLATQSCVSRTLPEGLLEHLGSLTFTQVSKQTAFKEKAPLALPAPGMGQRWEFQDSLQVAFLDCSKRWGPEQGHLTSALMEMHTFHLWVCCLSPDTERCGTCICVCEQCVHMWMLAWVSEPVKAGCYF